MYAFDGTECKIPNCSDPVWPNKTLGYCNRHYQRFKRGRMASDGSLLPLLVKQKVCDACSGLFELGKWDRNVRFCPSCRPAQRKLVVSENAVGLYRKRMSGAQKRYIILILNKIIRDCEKSKKHGPMVMAWKSGKKQSDIAKQYGISRQRVSQILSDYK